MLFVADASAVLACCFADEAGPRSESLLLRLEEGDSFVVPVHFLGEVTNAFAMAIRRKRITPSQAAKLLDLIEGMRFSEHRPPDFVDAKRILALSSIHALTAYDAAYLDLAMTMAIPLFSLDQDLLKAATAESVPLI
jgi:predicted nucleic acid-binding protein